MISPSNEAVLSLALGALAVYSTVLVGLTLARYLEFRRLRGTAVLTWPRHLTLLQRLLPALGILSAGVAVLNALLGRPLHHVYSQLIMAVYFALMVPLLARLPIGFYRDGVWADGGFIAWGRIGRLAFRETPEIVLLMLRRGRGHRLFRLPIPPGEYGAARRVLIEKIREHRVEIDKPILGLGDGPAV